MTDILNQFDPITLDEMKAIRLMNRIDTKFVTTVPMLRRLLSLAKDQYFVQEQGGLRISPYYTLYFDTEDCKMYNRHEAGHLARQKVRVRSYLNAGLNFLEVKTKNNHGRTKKKRIEVSDMDVHEAVKRDFLNQYLHYGVDTLRPALNNHFSRITLVNKAKTERLTIDSHLTFRNMVNGTQKDMGNLVIVELKRDGRVPSPILDMLRQLHIHPHGFSKYCMGSALTNPQLPCNRFKCKLIEINKIIHTA